MRKTLTIFFQVITVALGIVALAAMVRFPLTEGRAVNLDLFSIYADPFLAYIYLSSAAFFIALYQAFKLLGYIRQNKTFSPNSAKTLRTIKHCAATLGILIVLAALFIRIQYAKGDKSDDPAGFIALCIVATFIFIVVAIAAARFERRVKSAVNIPEQKLLQP